jgi:hypothetical protein
MTPERWHRIEVLFEQALELAESARSSFLDQACAGDPELHRELVELLASSPHAGASLRDAVVAEVQVLASDAAAAPLGRRIGPFRLLTLIGEGGMGAVYLAERDDAQFHHRVAIKILQHSVGSPEAVARFRDERQILAALEHPNIVRLLDGGSTDDGLPYLAMEHIEGETITIYAKEHELPMRARIALVRQVCAALQYAHQNLVVHRDIKPSNILVDAAGAPKVLDFGIAKLLAPVAGFELKAETRPGSAMFTPGYASPEQARGDAVSTATDVYSVGAVLYELATGQPPHRTTGNALDNLRVINEIDPPRPSAAAPRERRRELTGDLDNIILKALHRDPARRYASMDALSDDLGCFLDGRPIMARTATFGYRLRKFVHRHAALVIATALVSITMLGAGVMLVRQVQGADVQARRADEQAALAKAEQAKALDAAEHARAEAKHARDAEAIVTSQLRELQDKQAALTGAEAKAQAEAHKANQLAAQLQEALATATQDKRLAEQESARAHEAERSAEEAVLAETKIREEAEALYQKEREHARQLEAQKKTLTNTLP